MKNYFPKTVGLCGFGTLIGWLLFRTTGIHSDEVNYLRIAERYFFGDSPYSKKPCLFYILNYVFSHTTGLFFGPLYPWSFYLAYALMISLGLVWMIQPLYDETRKINFVLIYSILLLSPLTLLNSTQFMMETPIILILTLLFGCLMRTQDLRRFVYGLSVLAVAIKSTAVSPLIILALVFFKNKRASSIAILLGIASGCLVTSLLVFWAAYFPLHLSPPPINYGRTLSELLDVSSTLDHLKMTSFYLYSWIFFVGPPAIVGTLGYLLKTYRQPSKIKISDPEKLILLKIIIISWAFTFGIQMVSSFFYVRYTYPTLFLGLIASIYLVGRSKIFALIPLVIFSYVQSSPLISDKIDRFKYWPTLVNAEFFQAPLTIFYGTPTHRALLGLRLNTDNPCIEIQVPAESDTVGWYTRYLQFIFPKFKAETTKACDHRWRLQAWRESVPNFNTPDSHLCEVGHSYSSFQEILFPLVDGNSSYLNSTCITASQKLGAPKSENHASGL